MKDNRPKVFVNAPGNGRKGFRSIPLKKRLWTKVLKTKTCWEWTATKNPDGYGLIKLEGRMESAHRLVYRLKNGPIPKGLYVLHRCDVPRCVNPKHLFLGTQADNVRDMFRKGRGNPSGHKNVKIEDILEAHEG